MNVRDNKITKEKTELKYFRQLSITETKMAG